MGEGGRGVGGGGEVAVGGGVCYMRACVGRGSAGGGVPVWQWQYSVTSSSGGVGPGGCQDTVTDVLIFILVLDSLLQTLTSGSHVEFRTIDDDRGCVDFVKSTRAMHIA